MKRILIIAATKVETDFFNKKYTIIKNSGLLKTFEINQTQIDILITGIGIPFTIYNLTKILNQKIYKLVLNIGIAGTYGNYKIGDVVNVAEDEFADLGFENENSLNTLFDEGFLNANEYPFSNGKLYSNHQVHSKIIQSLNSVKGVTVNKATTNNENVRIIKHKFNPDIETMEGAAVFYVCLKEEIPCIQIRAISNGVGVRDKNKWNMPLALNKLENVVLDFLEEII